MRILYNTIDINRLSNLSLYQYSVDPKYPLSTAVFTLLITLFFNQYARIHQQRSDSSTIANYQLAKIGWRAVATRYAVKLTSIMYNLSRIFLSFLILGKIGPLLMANFKYRRLFEGYCDGNSWFYNNGVGYWAWIYYLFKYYDLFGTAAMVVWRRREDKYGVLSVVGKTLEMVGMWGLIATRAFAVWIFVICDLISQVVTHLYYLISCVGQVSAIKPAVTVFQLTGMLIQIILGLFYSALPRCACVKENSPFDPLSRWIDTRYNQQLFLGLCIGYSCFSFVYHINYTKSKYKLADRHGPGVYRKVRPAKKND